MFMVPVNVAIQLATFAIYSTKIQRRLFVIKVKQHKPSDNPRFICSELPNVA